MRSTGSVNSSRLPHLPELDGLRGIAALAVFLHHVLSDSIPSHRWPNPILTLRAILFPASAGVDLFFVLSGFLITSLLLDARPQATYYHDFYWKRALRILPLYAVVLLYVLAAIPQSGGYVLLSALFLSNFALLFHVASAGPFWTLAIEEQFYILWPTVVRRLSVVQLRRGALLVALSAVALRFVAAAFGHYNYYFTFLHCDGLAAGAYLALRFCERNRTPTSLAPNTIILATIALAAVPLCMPFLLFASTNPHVALYAAMYQTGINLLFTTAVAFTITHTAQPKLALLRTRTLTFFGLISYALYMTHLYVMYAYDRYHPLQSGDVPAYLTRLVIILTITIAICLLSRYIIELPANRLRRFVLRDPPLANQSPT